MNSIKVGDEVVVADNRRNTYRSDVYVVTVLRVEVTPNRTKWHLSDNSAVTSVSRMYKLGEGTCEVQA